jgi:hypothetical protein
MSTIGRGSGLDRLLRKLDTAAGQGAQAPRSPERTNTGLQAPTSPTSPESPLKRRNAIGRAGGMAGRNVALAALRVLGGANRPRGTPNPTPTQTPWTPTGPTAMPMPMPQPMPMPMPQPWVNRPVQRPVVPAKPPELQPQATPLQMPQAPSLPNPWERLANNRPTPPHTPYTPYTPPLPNPWDRPAHWQQPAPQGFPQRPGVAPGQQADAYPIRVKVPQGQQKLFRKEQREATSVPTLSKNIGRLYKQLNLKVTADTLPAFTNAQVLEKPKTLGSGAFNTVFSVKLKNPDGTPFDGVFKPLGSTEKGWVAAATGIPKDDPQIAMRNIATVSYAKKLGLDVVPSTRLAVIDTGRGVVDPDLGLIMEKARGKPASQVDPSVLSRPDVCAEVTKLQLLDHLTGQGDRHANNYFINIEPDGRAKVMGIDNDQCFGKNLKDPAGIQQINHDRLRYGFRGTGLPPVVDTEMARAINAMTSRDIRAMLGNKLSEPEIQAAIERHEGVKNHIARLRATGHIIDPSQWGDVLHLLNGQNSYLGRERDRALAKHNW